MFLFGCYMCVVFVVVVVVVVDCCCVVVIVVAVVVIIVVVVDVVFSLWEPGKSKLRIAPVSAYS